MSETKKMSLGNKILIGVLVLSSLGLGTAATGAYILTREISTKHHQVLTEFQTQLQDITPRFLEDQKILAQNPLFLTSPGKADAQHFLYQLEQNKTLALPENLQNKAEIYKEALEIKFEALDFSWMKSLQDYDHILLTQHPENQALLQKNAYTMPFAMHLGNHMPMVYWFRLRILKGLSDGDMQSAVKEARHLAYVFLNGESLIHSMIAISMLKWENEAHAYWQSKGKAPADWQPLDTDVLQRAKRVYPAASSYAMLGFTPPDLMEKVLSDPQVKVGICAGFMESHSSLMSYALFPERKALVEKMSQWIAARPCHHQAYFKNLWDNPIKASEGAFSQSDQELYALRYLHWMPWIRQYIGYTLESIAIPNFLRGYEEEKPAT